MINIFKNYRDFIILLVLFILLAISINKYYNYNILDSIKNIINHVGLNYNPTNPVTVSIIDSVSFLYT